MYKTKNENIKKIEIYNKNGIFHYKFLEKYLAGIVLTGEEVKLIKLNKVSIQKSYCYFIKNEI